MLQQYGFLLSQFILRDIQNRYRGSFLGMLWLVLTPVLMLTIFTFVFHGIFGMKWPGNHEQTAFSFALFLFVGLSVYQFFSEVINRSASLIVQQPNLVTKVVFPLWIVPLAMTLATSLTLFINLILLLLIAVFYLGSSWQWLWIPVILFPLLLGVLGGAWLFAALGVYARDISHLLGMATTAMMFLSPIFYPLASVPEQWQFWFMLNPLTLVVESLRGVMLLQQSPNLLWLVMLYAVGLSSFFIGYTAFRRLQRGFADVL